MKNSNTRISFYLLSSKLNEKKKSPVYMFLKKDGKKIKFSTGIWLSLSEWDKKKERVKGASNRATAINTTIKDLHDKVFSCINDLRYAGTNITLEAIRQLYKGNKNKQTLVFVFDSHIADMQDRKGEKGFSVSSVNQYQYTKLKLIEFLKSCYKTSDVHLGTLNFDFIERFSKFLSSHYGNKRNTIQKNLVHLKCVVNKCRNRGLIKDNPFKGFVNKGETITSRLYLTIDEVQKIEDLDLSFNERLDNVKDAFLWICYTGIAYADSKSLTLANIISSIEGKSLISYSRTKTGIDGNIPLFDKAKAILNKYKMHPEVVRTGCLLPFISNQKMNQYLKTIGEKAGISKNLTTHVGRHTFATIALNNSCPIDTVSKMLNHTSLKTTQIYAKITLKKLESDTECLSKLFGRNPGEGMGQPIPSIAI